MKQVLKQIRSDFSFPTVGDWSMKPEWESEIPRAHSRLPETMVRWREARFLFYENVLCLLKCVTSKRKESMRFQTAPNLSALVGNNCTTPNSSSPMVPGHMMTSMSVSSFTQHAKHQQQHTANFMSVAQQLVK